MLWGHMVTIPTNKRLISSYDKVKVKVIMRMYYKIHVVLAFVVALSLVSGITGIANGQEQLDRESENGYLVIFYPMKNTVLSSEIAGTVKKMPYDMGQSFKKGDVLLTLDPDYAYAEMEKADSTRAYADEVYQAKKKLYEQKSISSLEYTKSEADLRISKANLAIARKKLASCTIRAPYSGKVVKRVVRENEFVPEGQALIEILDDTQIQAKFHLPSDMYPLVQVGRTYVVSVNKLSFEFKCKVTHISPVMESNTNSFQVFAEIANADNRIRAGMTGFIKIESITND